MPLRFTFIPVLFSFAFATTQAQNTSPFWSLAGNSNAATTSKLGTTTSISLNLTTNNSTRLKIFENGRVGVGGRITNTNATRVLNLADDNAVMRILRTHASFAPAIELISRTSADGANVAYWDLYAEPSDKSFRIRDRVTGSNLDRVTIKNNGNVGIATTAPLQKLHVNGNAQFNGSVGVNGAMNTNYALTVNTNGSLNGIEVTDPVHGSVLSSVKSGILSGIRIEKTATGTGTACITGNSTGSSPGLAGFSSTGIGVIGNSANSFGIYGESSGPSTDEAGYAGRFISNNYRGIFAQGSTGFFAGYFNGSVFSTGSFLSSDGRLKKNIQDVSGAMDILNKLQPKLYEFRRDGQYALLNLPNGRHYGLLAEEVEKVLPEMVKDAGFNTNTAKPMKRVVEQAGKEITLGGEEKNGEDVAFKAINYTEFTPIIIKALQEQDAQNKAKEERIKRLEEENADIKRQLAELKALITKNTNATVNISSAYLEQSVPNPSRGTTTIRYGIPDGATSARLTLTNSKGQLLRTINLNGRGTGQVNLDTTALSAGVYNYTLWVTGREVDTKQLVITR